MPTSFVSGPKPLRLALSKPTFPELLFGALRVPDVSGGFPPALFPRFAEAASGRFARHNSPFSSAPGARRNRPTSRPASQRSCQSDAAEGLWHRFS